VEILDWTFGDMRVRTRDIGMQVHILDTGFVSGYWLVTRIFEQIGYIIPLLDKGSGERSLSLNGVWKRELVN
jgi:hypothetical protein